MYAYCEWALFITVKNCAPIPDQAQVTALQSKQPLALVWVSARAVGVDPPEHQCMRTVSLHCEQLCTRPDSRYSASSQNTRSGSLQERVWQNVSWKLTLKANYRWRSCLIFVFSVFSENSFNPRCVQECIIKYSSMPDNCTSKWPPSVSAK